MTKLTMLKVIAASAIAIVKLVVTNASACFLDTLFDGKGLFLPLARSRSKSIKSFKMYVPAVTSKEASGRSKVV
jgi:hypothetical protein